jgi:hypothetical protein
MNANDLVDAISWYQKQEDVRPLTCIVDSSHALLLPRVDGKSVVLVCPTCGHVQKNVPEVIWRLYNARER